MSGALKLHLLTFIAWFRSWQLARNAQSGACLNFNPV